PSPSYLAQSQRSGAGTLARSGLLPRQVWYAGRCGQLCPAAGRAGRWAHAAAAARDRPLDGGPGRGRLGATGTAQLQPQGGEPDAFARSLAPLLQLYAGLPAADLDTAKLEAVRQEMIRRGWCRNVINRRVVRIKTLWRWAEAQGHVPRGS